MTSHLTSKSEREPRPFGVWLASGYAILFAAFMPLFTRLWALTFPPNAGFEAITLPHLLFIAGMSLTIAVLACYTWKGNNNARIALLIFITLHYGLIAFDNASWLSANAGDPDFISMFFMRMARAIIVPAIFIWYFTEPEVKCFFGSRPQ